MTIQPAQSEKADSRSKEKMHAAIVTASNRTTQLLAQGQFNEARQLWKRVLAECRQVLGDDDVMTLMAHVVLSKVDVAEGAFAVAGSRLQALLPILRRKLALDDPALLRVLAMLAHVEFQQGRLKLALAFQEELLEATQRKLERDNPETILVLSEMSVMLLAVGDVVRSRAFAEETHAVLLRIAGADSTETLSASQRLADVLRATGKYAEALALLEPAAERSSRLLGANAELTASIVESLVTARAALDEESSLRSLLAKAIESGFHSTNEQVLATAERNGLTIAEKFDQEAMAAEAVFCTILGHRAIAFPGEDEQLLGLVDSLRKLGNSDHQIVAEILARLRAAISAAGNDRQAGMRLATALVHWAEILEARRLQRISILLKVEAIYQILQSKGLQSYSVHEMTLSLAHSLRTAGQLNMARELQERILQLRLARNGVDINGIFDVASELMLTLHAQGDVEAEFSLCQAVLSTLSVEPNSYTTRTILSSAGDTLLTFAGNTLPWLLNDASGLRTRPAWLRKLVNLLIPVSRQLQEDLEILDSEALAEAMINYVQFHTGWQRFCARWSPEDALAAVAPLHGTEAWASALGDMLVSQSMHIASVPHTVFLEARAALNTVRARIADINTHILELTNANLDRGDAQVRQALRERLVAELHTEATEERAALARYTAAKVALAEVDLTFAAILSPAQLRVPDFAARLHPGDAALILVRFNDHHSAFVITADSRADWLALPSLEEFVLHAQARETLWRDEHRGGLRDWFGAERTGDASRLTFSDEVDPADSTPAQGHAAQRKGTLRLADLFGDAISALGALFGGGAFGKVRRKLDAEHAGAALLAGSGEHGPSDNLSCNSGVARSVRVPSLVEVEQAAVAGFWVPLREAFGEVRRWHIVTGPGQHGLPLEMGRPVGVVARYYCGLPACWRLFNQPLPLPTLGTGMDISIDAAWGTNSPIPFVECEADLLRHIFTSRGVEARRRDGVALLDGRPLAARVQVACHGKTVGQVGRAYGVLVLDAAAGVVLEPARAAHLFGPMVELFASSCWGGVVSQTAGGDAQGMVPPLQLRGLPVVLACLAPVSDFYMPMLVALYWHARVTGVLPHEALEQAKSQLRSGNWPPELLTPVRAAYTVCMTDVLERTATLDPGNRATIAAARSVAGWCLPDEVRKKHFWKSPKELSWEDLRGFVQERCASVDRRTALVTEVADRLIAGRHELPAAACAAIEHLCAYTVCFGDMAQVGA